MIDEVDVLSNEACQFVVKLSLCCYSDSSILSAVSIFQILCKKIGHFVLWKLMKSNF